MPWSYADIPEILGQNSNGAFPDRVFEFMEIKMKNKIMTCVSLALASVITACCLSSCGVFGDMGMKDNASEKPSDVVSDIVDDVTPDKENGETVKKNADPYTADEKDENNTSMTERFRERFRDGK